MSQEPIRGKVAQILSDRELVINKGSLDGVTTGMEFNIIRTVPVEDPDTSQLLGKVEQRIISLEVFVIQEHLSVLFSKYKSITVGDKGPFTRSLLSSSKALVNIGDLVVQYIKEEKPKLEDSNEK